MFKYKNLKSFISNSILGIILIALAIFIFGSLYSYNANDAGFGVSNNLNNIHNFFGSTGAYTSSVLIAIFSLTSYLLPTFFLIIGCRLLLGIKTDLILVRFFFNFIGIFFSGLFLSSMKLQSGIFGASSFSLFSDFFSEYLKIDIIFWLSSFVFFLLSLFFILISYNIKFKLIFKLSTILQVLKYIFIPFILLFNKIVKTRKDKKYYKSVLKNLNTTKREPTHNKRKVREKTLKEKNSKVLNGSSEFHYVLPSPDLLKKSNSKSGITREIERQSVEFSKKLEQILSEFGVEGKITNYKYGPVVTLYEFLPAAGVKTSKVVGLSEDITRAMSSLSTRIALQPGKTSLGIEIPNLKREDVALGDLIKDDAFFSTKSGLTLALGKNITGEKIYTDLEKMPHLLIAGTTGSGKSVGINSMIMSLLFRFTPSECKLILIDPKMLELRIYEDIPHLLTPVVTNPNKAVFALKWVVREMENRYRLMSSLNVKNIKSFNSKILSAKSTGRKLYREVQTGIDNDTRMPIIEKKEIPLEKMPLIVVVLDEMADLMMVAGKEVENLVQRLAQMARASGIHLIAATQRPSVDVITGTIKANFPSRISFRVASRFDSRTILNEMGAEQLLGSGDMLFLENGATLNRLHGGYISEFEIESVVNHIKSQSNNEKLRDITLEDENLVNNLDLGFENNKDVDELYDKALTIIIEQQKVSTSFIQRYLQIGYNRAARIVEKMEEDGYISEASGSGKRNVLRKTK